MNTTRLGSFCGFLVANTAQEPLDFLRAAELLRFTIGANPAHMNAAIDHAHIHARCAVDAQFLNNADLSFSPIESVRWARLDA